PKEWRQRAKPQPGRPTGVSRSPIAFTLRSDLTRDNPDIAIDPETTDVAQHRLRSAPGYAQPSPPRGCPPLRGGLVAAPQAALHGHAQRGGMARGALAARALSPLPHPACPGTAKSLDEGAAIALNPARVVCDGTPDGG